MNNISKYQAFEEIVYEILEQHYELKKPLLIDRGFVKYDFETSNGVPIEVKYSSQNNITRVLIRTMECIAQNNYCSNIILVTNVFGLQQVQEKLCNDNYGRIKIITLENLLYLCNSNEELKSRLISCIEFSTESILELPLDEEVSKILHHAQKEKTLKSQKISANCKDRLSKIEVGKNEFSEYEDFCFDFIKTVFQNNIDTPVTQRKNNKGIFRFDMVASLKDNPESFWKFIYDKFNSCFILFECKNYRDKIKQEQIYLTERYLYNNALRNVAIILTRKGADKNAVFAAQDILKEHGKLILILDDKDIIALDKIHKEFIRDRNLKSPSDYLLEKTKEFLLDIDK